MQYLYITLLLVLFLPACNKDEQKMTQIQIEKDNLLAEIKAKDEALHKARLEAKIAKEKLLKQEQEKKEAFLRSSEKKEKEQKEALKDNKLSNIGITIDKNKITLDTNKTKEFFQNISQIFGNKLKKITQDLEKGILDEKCAGVNIDKTHVNIDFNKTKNFLDAWDRKMQGFVKEFNDISKVIDTQAPNIQTKGN